MAKVADALKETRQLEPQTVVPVETGGTIRRTSGGIPIVRLHYSDHPGRNAEENPQWKKTERKKYTSQASWDREQEIRDEAGGGELVFADTLITHWNKIVINDPRWRPNPNWRIEGGFDYGKTNPTCLTRCYFDHDGVGYFCGEYYMPGLQICQHAPRIKDMQDVFRMAVCHADPSIFSRTMEQTPRPGEAQQRARSVNELYEDEGLTIFSPFHGDRSDISFAERLLMHWGTLEECEPTIRIVCRNYSERPQPGLHNWDCPNLLWELMRIRRVKLTAQQLLTRNLSEAIVDKDNHAIDVCKYIVMSHPEPTRKPYQERVEERLQQLWKDDPTQAMLQLSRIQQEERGKEVVQQVYYGNNIRQKLAEEAAKGNRW
jgi:hypothetical protein